jgi:hypothetical protein
MRIMGYFKGLADSYRHTTPAAPVQQPRQPVQRQTIQSIQHQPLPRPTRRHSAKKIWVVVGVIALLTIIISVAASAGSHSSTPKQSGTAACTAFFAHGPYGTTSADLQKAASLAPFGTKLDDDLSHAAFFGGNQLKVINQVTADCNAAYPSYLIRNGQG